MARHAVDEEVFGAKKARRPLAQFRPHGFRRGGRSGGAAVRDEFRDRHVGFMTDPGDDGGFEGRDRTSERFVVEGVEVFKGSAPSHEQEKVCAALVRGAKPAADRSRGVRPLYEDICEGDADPRRSALERRKDVVQSRPLAARQHADVPHEGGEGLFALRPKETFGLELGAKPQKGFVERPHAGAPHAKNAQLQVARSRIDHERARHLELVARADFEVARGLEALQNPREEDAADLPALVAQGEVAVVRGRDLRFGHLSRDPPARGERLDA